MIPAVLNAVLPVLAAVGLGFAWVRLGRAVDNAVLTPIAADLATPCLIVSTLARTRIPPDAFAAVALASATAILCSAALGAVAIAAAGLRLRTFLPSVAFPNAGNLGLPVSLYAFGPEGLGYAVVFFALSSIGNYTVGQAIAAGQANWRAVLRMPLIYAVLVGVAASFWQVELPRWAASLIALLGGMAVPLMLLMLGAALARLRVAALGRAAGVAALRIGLGAAIGIAVARLFGLGGTAQAVLILQCAMPVAVYTYLFAQRWNNEPEEVAGAVVVSTAASAVTTPALLGWLLAVS